MKKEILVNISILLICLIISLPFLSADALATTIYSAKVHGQNQIEGYRMPADYTEIIVEAQIDNDPNIEPSQLTIPDLGIYSFDSCEELTIDGAHQCTYQTPVNIKQGSQLFKINLLDKNSQPVSTKTVELTIDDKPPEIVSFTITQNENSFTAAYSLIDSACTGMGCENKCSGIKKIEFHNKGGDVVKTIDVESKECAVSGSEELILPQGENTLTLVAYDKLENIGVSEEVPLAVDLDAPQVIATIDLFDKYGSKVTVIGKTETIGNTLAVYVKDENLDPKTVTADISELISDYYDVDNPPYNAYRKKPATKCNEKESNIWVCTWLGLIIAIKEDGGKTIKIEATDTKDNHAESYITYKFSVDKSDADAKSLKSIYQRGGINYLGIENNTILLEMIEAESGFMKGALFIDFSEIISLDYAKTPTQGCLKQEDVWTCEWKNVNVLAPIQSGANLMLSLVIPSANDVGNPIKGNVDNEFIYDGEIPIVTNHTQETSSGSCPISGDVITYSFEVIETISKDLKVYANASRISSHDALKEGSCFEKSPGKWRCTVDVDGIKSMAHKSAPVEFLIKDLVGNEAEVVQYSDICAITSTGTPECISSINPSLSGRLPSIGIDRRTASYDGARYRVYQELGINYHEEGACEIIEKKVNSCEATLESLVSTPYLINQDLKTDILAMEFNHPSFDEDKLVNGGIEVICNLSLKMKQGLLFYKKPENQIVKVQIPVDGRALGDVDSQWQRKMDEVDTAIENAQERMDKWDGWNKWSKKICEFGQYLAFIDMAYMTLRIIVYWIMMGIGTAVHKCKDSDPTGSCLTTLTTIKVTNGGFTKFDTGWVKWAHYGAFPPGFIGGLSGAIHEMFKGDFTWILQTLVGLLNKISCISYNCMFAYKPGELDIDLKDFKSENKDNIITIQTENGEEPATNLNQIPDKTTYIENAWKAETSSWDFVCPGAEIYNAYKKKQIACMKKNCLLKAQENGHTYLPCLIQEDVQKCLYIESAAGRLGMLEKSDWSNFGKWSWFIVNELGAIGITTYCQFVGTNVFDKATSEKMWLEATFDTVKDDLARESLFKFYTCMSLLTLLELSEVGWYASFDNYMADDYPTEPDFCSET
jgi:hypothetical protein